MEHRDIIVGLDVGTTKICAVVAEIGGGIQPNILGVGISPCTGLKKGAVVDLEATTTAIRDAVGRAERMSGVEVSSVVVGVTGEHISCLNSRSVIAINNSVGEISSSDVDRVLDNARVLVLPPDREIIHAIPRWYSVDGQHGVQSPVGMHGNRLEVETHIVTGLSSFIQNVVKCVHQAGLAVDGTVLEPIATGESVLLPAEKDLGIAVVDIGGGTSDVAIYIDGEIYYSGVVPIGGNHFTRDVAVGLRTTIEEAERVKVEHGCALAAALDGSEIFEVASMGNDQARRLPTRVLAEIIEPRAAELCQLVLAEIEKAECLDRLPVGLVFTGGGSLLRGLPELATKEIGLAARTGEPFGVAGFVDAVSNPSCATAVGLVLYASRYHMKHLPEVGGRVFLQTLHGIIDKVRELIARFGIDLKQ